MKLLISLIYFISWFLSNYYTIRWYNYTDQLIIRYCINFEAFWKFYGSLGKYRVPYHKLLPIYKIQKNYLTWSENWTYQHSLFKGFKYRIDIWILGLFRFYRLPINQNRLKMQQIDRNYDNITLFMNKKYHK